MDCGTSPAVLLVADLFQPFDGFAVQRFLNGDMGHGRFRRGTMPMLLAGWKPDHVPGADFLDRTAQTLRQAGTGGDDQGLAERMRMPGRAGTRLESHIGPADACRRRCLE